METDGPKFIENKDADQDDLLKYVDILYNVTGNVIGNDVVKKRAVRGNLYEYIECKDLRKKVYALMRIVFKDSDDLAVPSDDEIREAIEKVEDELANILAKRHVEADIRRKVDKILVEKQEKYMEELKLSILKKRTGCENAKTLKKYADLEVLDRIKLSKSVRELLRPSNISEIIGQEKAIKSLISKIASPFPQHVILYGPPGVGKTTAARLALEEAKKISYTPFKYKAKFVEVDGTTLRWDPREITNPLLGSVHDPIYQGSKRDLAEDGIAEPKPGLVTEAHGGVLFIDEIGELDEMLQNKLLKVLEDKKVEFSSAYYDPDDENTPMYIKKLFEEGAPADFVLIGATTRQPDEISPALRSRCTEVFFEPLSKDNIVQIIENAAEKLGIIIDDGVARTISDYTIEGRRAVGILADVYGYTLYKNYKSDYKGNLRISKDDLLNVLADSRMVPYSKNKARGCMEAGRILGLGVFGYLGSVIEIEAVAFKVEKKGQGKIRFNEQAGTMARDSVYNAASVIRKLTGKDLSDLDIHVNVIGGGNVDGPSAGAALVCVILSAIDEKPIRQDVAVTGEISIRGNIKPVGGILEKIYGAKQAGIKKVIIPQENMNDVPKDIRDIEIVPVSEIEQVIEVVF
ncbi:MAG TPA: ATP-dependent protease, Lon family [Clostridiaceae bacterium]|nr:ATP-dependent protease, Lon family [Clostridiaceae bacterium]